MGLIDEIKSLFGAGEQTFRYRCLDCDAEFASDNPVMAEVPCPECRSTRITNASPVTA